MPLDPPGEAGDKLTEPEQQMDCKECERRIPEFLNRELNYVTLKRFKNHIESCPDCKEELVIQFLVTEGMTRLEEGSAFDLQKELDKRMDEASRKIHRNEGFLKTGLILELFTFAATAAFLIWLIW